MDSGESLRARHTQLKQKLYGLNYSNNFGIDAVETIDQLLTDLISTTESYKQLHDKEKRLSDDLVQTQAQLFPLRKDNAKLAKENYQLHIEKESTNEEHLISDEKLKSKIKSLEDNLNELKRLSMYKDDLLFHKESQYSEIRTAYEKLTYETSHKSNVKVKRFIEIKPQAQQQSSTSNSTSKNQISFIHTPTPIHTENEHSIIPILRDQLDSLHSTSTKLQVENTRLKTLLDMREQELNRNVLNFNIDSSSSQDQMQLQVQNNQRVIDHLNGQVDFLNEQLAKKEFMIANIGQQNVDIEALKNECLYRGKQLDECTALNTSLASQLHQLEYR
eukprot:gene13374-28342_t